MGVLESGDTLEEALSLLHLGVVDRGKAVIQSRRILCKEFKRQGKLSI